MRGKAYGEGNVEPRVRITPAYAGKSFVGRQVFFLAMDHPRLCGEKGNRKRVCPAFCRITPAYAGKSGGFYYEKD